MCALIWTISNSVKFILQPLQVGEGVPYQSALGSDWVFLATALWVRIAYVGMSSAVFVLNTIRTQTILNQQIFRAFCLRPATETAAVLPPAVPAPRVARFCQKWGVTYDIKPLPDLIAPVANKGVPMGWPKVPHTRGFAERWVVHLYTIPLSSHRWGWSMNNRSRPFCPRLALSYIVT